MRVLLAVDGSKFTKKALAFLVTHEALMGADAELIVLNVGLELGVISPSCGRAVDTARPRY